MSKLKKILSVLLSLILAISTIITVLPIAHAETNTNYDVLEDTIEIDEPFEEYYKDLKELIPGEDYVEGEIIIKYSPENSEQSLNDIANEFDLDVECKLENGSNTFDTLSVDDSINEDGLFVLSFTEDKEIADLVQEVTSVEEIEYAQPNYLYDLCSDDNYIINNDTINGYDSQEAMFNSINIGSETYTGEGVVVAVIDSGIDMSHPALQGCFWNDNGVVGYDAYHDVEITINDDDIFSNDHGTHVAGIIAMQQIGAYTCKGIASDVKIMNLQATDDNNQFETASIVRALEFAESNGADIVNMSFGNIVYDYTLNKACNAAAREMVLVAAAGNSGTNREAHYPAAFSSVIGVMAYGGSGESSGYPDEIKETITDNDSLLSANYPAVGNMIMADFSTHDTKRKYYDIVAPGVNICSTKARESTEISDDNFDDYDYVFLSGTSMSSPVVAGVAALYLDKNPDATPGQVREALRRNSGKNVEIYNSFISQDDEQTKKFIQNQLDVSFVLSVSPNTDIDTIYERDDSEADLLFCSLIKEQFDGAIANDENLTYEDLRLVSYLSFDSFETIEKYFQKFSELPNLFSISFTGESFNDENIRLILNSSNFENLIDLEISESKITNFIFPSNFAPNLGSLTLKYNPALYKVADLSCFNDIYKVIVINSVKINDISFLQNATTLSYLQLTACNILDVEPLSLLTNLDTLMLSSNKITNIEPLSNLVNLKSLSIINNYITDISPLQNLEKLLSVFAQNNLINNIGNILELKNLVLLDLKNNFLSDNTTIHNAISDKTLADSALRIFYYTPDKDFVPVEKIISYDTSFKRTELFTKPNLFAFPYDASHKNNVNLSSSNNYIKVNPYSNTLSYNKAFSYDANQNEYRSVISYECDGVSGCLDAYLLMPTIETASIEKYNFDNTTYKNYISLSTTIDTTKVRVEGVGENGIVETEYNLDSDNVWYEDYGDERIIKIDISDTFNVDSRITISTGDDIGYFASENISYAMDIEVEKSQATGFNGEVEKLFLLEDTITGIASTAISSDCYADILVLPESVSSIAENAFDNCNISEVYIINNCSNALVNIFNNCTDMVVYVSYNSPLKNFSGPTIVSDYHFENNKLVKYYGNDSNVVIPKYFNLNTIGDSAFATNDAIETIELTNAINTIESNSFANCSNLSGINSILELDNIGQNAFADTELQKIAIIFHNDDSNNAALIDTEGLFKNCENLEVVYFESKNSEIDLGKEIFCNCKELKYIDFSSTKIINVGEKAFKDCSAIEKIPFDNMLIDGKQAFKNCLNLLGNIVFWGDCLFTETFYNCPKIDSITFMNSVTLEGYGLSGTTALTEIGFISGENSYCTSESFSGCGNINIYVNGDTLIDSDTNNQYSNNNLNICTDFVLDGKSFVELLEYLGENTDVVIPECLMISEISDFAFCYNEYLCSVHIPDSVTTISKYAFEGCENLKDVSGGRNVATINDGAFSGCINLKNISMFSSVVSIGGLAFARSGVEKVVLPNTVLMCELAAFAGCENLTEFEFSGVFTNIPTACFRDCPKLERCVLNYSCKNILENAFLRCESLKQIYIPNSVTNIGNNALPTETILFCEKDAPVVSMDISNSIYPNYEIANGILLEYQSDLEYDYEDVAGEKIIEVPNAATKINDNVFKNNEIVTKVILSDYLDCIGESAFFSARSIKTIKMPSEMSYIGANAFNKVIALKDITIPYGITTIERNTFFQTSIEGFRIPDTVTEIKDGAFWHCSNLKSVYVPNSVQTISSMAFADCNIRLTLFGESGDYLPNYVTENSEINGNNLISCSMGFVLLGNALKSYIGTDKNVQVPFSIGLTKISAEAFKDNTIVESISIASGINEIGDNCFSSCNSLTSVVMTPDITTFGSNIFSSTNNLKVYCKVNTTAYNYCVDNNIQVETDYDISDGVLNKYNGTSANVIIPTDLCITQIGNGSIYDGFRNNNTLQEVVIPEGTIYIGRFAFSTCKNLEQVTFPETLLEIEAHAFILCEKLHEINWPSSLKYIGPYAFTFCRSLVAVDLTNIETIEYHAFDSCDSLETAKFGSKTISIGTECFIDCPNLTFECIEDSYAHYYAIENGIAIQLTETSANNTYSTQRTLNNSSLVKISEETTVIEEFDFEEYLEENHNGEISEENWEQIILGMEVVLYRDDT